MKIGKLQVNVFKMKNRSGYAAICAGCLTEGKTKGEAIDRMEKAVKRVTRKPKR